MGKKIKIGSEFVSITYPKSKPWMREIYFGERDGTGMHGHISASGAIIVGGVISAETWIAWRGWKTPMTLLCSDWIYKDLKVSDNGLSNYNGKARKELLGKKKSVNFNTALSQIDTINQATELSRNLKPLTKIEFEKLFS